MYAIYKIRDREGSISIRDYRRSTLGVLRFSEGEQLSGKYLFTHGSDPQHEWYEDYPLSIFKLEEDPSPPNDNEIAE